MFIEGEKYFLKGWIFSEIALENNDSIFQYTGYNEEDDEYYFRGVLNGVIQTVCKEALDDIEITTVEVDINF